MDRGLNTVYLFIQDEQLRYLSAVQDGTGSWLMQLPTANMRLSQPLRNNPANISGSYLEFSTNQNYFSLARSINYPLEFIKDGAFILNYLFEKCDGVKQKAYLTVVEWDGSKYVLSYRGRFDFFKKNWNPEQGKFTCPCVDDSAWGVISNNDDTQYRVPCNASNPKAIRVLMDGITLVNNITYQAIKGRFVADSRANPPYNYLTILPVAIINQDGDSAGLILSNQSYVKTLDLSQDLTNVYGAACESLYATDITISGSLVITPRDNAHGGSAMAIAVATSLKNIHTLKTNFVTDNAPSSFEFSQTISLAGSERAWIVVGSLGLDDDINFDLQITNLVISTKTISEPVIVYALRPLDLLQDLVRQATKGRYTIKSNILLEENKDVLTCGQALRSLPNAAIYSSIKDFFNSFNPLKYLAIRNIKGEIWLEKAIEVYRINDAIPGPGVMIIDLGEALTCDFEVAEEMYASEIEIGSPVVDLRHASGRLEFNSTNKFSIDIEDTKNKISLVSKYRFGCYDAQFLILDYQNGSTQDNNGDNEVYALAITDEIGNGTDPVETFIEVNIDNATLLPFIKSPLTNDFITYNKPVIRGIAKPGDNIKIFADAVLDGNVNADADGNWSYEITNALTSYVPGITTGIHLIQATFTDLGAPHDSITITIDNASVTENQIIYPANNDNIYNNKPLLKGVAQRGTNINISLDGLFLATVVADSSCKWEFRMPVMSNAAHIIEANLQLINVVVNSNTAYPLITYFNSELDGFPVINNLPLIKGVGIPGTTVNLCLDYITYSVLGSVIIDANGNWEFQVIPVTYINQISGTPVDLAPIKNGLSVLSTSLVNNTVPIGISGFKLDRPQFSQLLGVPDNTIFNTRFSPKTMLMAHYPKFASMGVPINFTEPDKNGNLSRTLDGVTIKESANITRAEMGSPQFMLEYAKIRTNVKSTFNQLLYNFNGGGLISFTYRGKTIYCYPIGSMKIANVEDKMQDWRLLLSPLTTANTILNLYKNGTFITLNRGQMFHSDYNSLHGVEYGFVIEPKYQNLTMYQEWFEGRLAPWVTKPKYIKKFQKTETDIRDQITTNGMLAATMRVYDCAQAVEGNLDIGVVAVINYDPVNPVPTPGPNIVSEAIVDMSTLDDRKQYFAVTFFGETPVMIFERWEVRNKWDGTILIEAFASENIPGFYYSTGIRTILRIEGMVHFQQPNITSFQSKDDIGNTRSLYSLFAKKVSIRFGTAYGLPDHVYLKCAAAATLDNFGVEGQIYTKPDDEAIEPADQAPGHPLYFYNINVDPNENIRGKVFTNVPGENGNPVFISIDGEAGGLPPGEIISLELKNE